MHGKITVGVGTGEQRELQIVDFVQAHFKDNRTISVSQIEDGTFVGAVNNHPSTGRETQATIWLSKESFIALLSTALLYFDIKGEDMQKLLAETIQDGKVDYSFLDNLNGADFDAE